MKLPSKLCLGDQKPCPGAPGAPPAERLPCPPAFSEALGRPCNGLAQLHLPTVSKEWKTFLSTLTPTPASLPFFSQAM